VQLPPDPFEGRRHHFILAGSAGAFRKTEKMEIKLYVGNLSFTTTEDAIRTLFAQAGTVASVEVIKDRFTGNSKGFAFVQMSSQQEAEKAITMFNGYTLDNRELKVNPARPREDAGGRGGYGDRRNDSYGRGRGGPGGSSSGGRNRRSGGGSGPRRY
jgi:RNA recognition motif-containing protein